MDSVFRLLKMESEKKASVYLDPAILTGLLKGRHPITKSTAVCTSNLDRIPKDVLEQVVERCNKHCDIGLYSMKALRYR